MITGGVATRRFCYYVMEGQTSDDGGYIPSVVFENESGHNPLNSSHTWTWGNTMEDAKRYASVANRNLGLTDDDVMNIVASSMRAGYMSDF